MLFIYLYPGDLFSDLWKSDLYFRPATDGCLTALTFLDCEQSLSFLLSYGDREHAAKL